MKLNLAKKSIYDTVVRARGVYWWGVRVFSFAVLSIFLSLFSHNAYASGPANNHTLSYQLRLTDNNGIPVTDGTYSIKISIYTALAGGAPTYTDCGVVGAPVARKVVVVNGMGSVLVGNDSADGTTNCADDSAPNAIPGTLFNNNTLYFGITVAADAEMSPRKRIVSVGYALNADRLDDLETGSLGGVDAYIPVTNDNGQLVITGNPSAGDASLTVNPAAAANELILALRNSGADRFIVDAEGDTYIAGNVGIGTATPGQLLELNNGNIALGRWSNGAGAYSRTVGIVGFAGDFTINQGGSWIDFNNDGGNSNSIDFVTHNNGVDQGVRMTITNDGRVGIGTATPQSLLTIAGDITPSVDNTYNLGTPALRWANVHVGPGSLVIHNDATNTNKAVLDFSGATARLVTDAATPLQMTTGANVGVYVLANGRVGVGTNTPGSALDVTGDISINGTTVLTSGGALQNITGNTTLGDDASDTVTINGQIVTLAGANSIINMTGAGTLGLNTTTNRDITTGTGTFTTGGALSVNGSLWVAFGADYTTTGSQNDVNLGTSSVVRYTGAANATFTGIGNGIAGKVLTLMNASGNNLTLNDNDGASLPSNRIITGSDIGTGLVLEDGESVIMQYDPFNEMWRVTGSSKTWLDSSTAFVAYGNSFGVPMTIGLNDNFDLSIETNDVTRATFDTANGLSFPNGIAMTSGAATDITLTSGTTGVASLDSASAGEVRLGTGATGKTINIGTGAGGNTINIGSDDTIADTVVIGSGLDSLALVSANFSVSAAGNILTEGTLLVNGNTTLGNAGGDTVTLNASTLTFTNTGSIINMTGVGALSINTTSNHGITTGTGTFTDAGSMVINGNTTLGDAAGDTVTANAAAITLAGNDTVLNMTGTGTLNLNTTTNRAITTGTGLFTAAGALTVNGATTLGVGGVETITINSNTVNFTAAGTGTLNFASTGSLDTGGGQLLLLNRTNNNGILTGTGTFTAGGALIVDGALTVNGNTTLGDAPGDTVTLKAATLTLEGASTVIDMTGAGTLSLNTTTGRAVTTGSGLLTAGGSLTINGAALTLAGDSSILDMTGTGTLGLNTTTNRAITTGTGLLTAGGALTVTGNTTFTAAKTIDFASGVAGNTMIWNVPKLATTGGCNSGVAEGIIIKDSGGTQRGHICIFGPTNGGNPNQLHFYAAGFVSSATDIAETYSSNSAENLVAGDVVELDSSASGLMVKKSTAAYSSDVFGVVSTSPGVTLSGIDEATGVGDTTNGRLVALKGRVPVKVSTENGSIAIGDYLTTSGVAGVAMKATKPGMVLGRALDTYSGGGTGVIRIFVEVGWHSLDTITSDGTLAFFNDDFAFNAIASATSVIPARDSQSLTFRGSAWNSALGTAAARDFTLTTKVTDETSSTLSLTNAAGTELFSVGQNGDVMVTGKLFPADRGVAQTNRYIYYDGSAGAAGDMMRTNSAGWGTGSYDFAEMFPSNIALVAGDIVMVDPAKNIAVTRTVSSQTETVVPVGIVSTRPGFLAGMNDVGSYPIALKGRVPTRVSAQNGAIRVGDPITASSQDGVGMKATDRGYIIGFALETWNGDGVGFVTVMIQPGWFNGSVVMSPNATSNAVLGSALTSTLDLNGNDIINARMIRGMQNVWSIDERGNILTEGTIGTRFDTQTGSMTWFAPLSPKVELTFSGSGRLTNGAARIDFDGMTQQIISDATPIKVMVTLTENAKGLYVLDKSVGGFNVREIDNGTSSASFDWSVIARRKGFDDAGAVAPPPLVVEPQPVIAVTPPVVEVIPTQEQPPAPAEPAPASETVVETPPVVEVIPTQEQPPAPAEPAPAPTPEPAT